MSLVIENEPIKKRIAKHLWTTESGRTVRFGVGCAWLGRRESYLDTLSQDLNVLMSCYEKGFRYYDTSRAYGNSEQTVGEFINRIDRKSIFLATKSPYPRIEGSGQRNFQIFKDNFYQSFERLHTDHIDLFQIHDTDHFECCTEDVIPFLLERKSEKMISYIGMGTLSLNAHENAVCSGMVNSVLSYLNYSILKKSASHVIDVCRTFDAAFVNASIFHYGLIRSEDPFQYRLDYNPPHMARNRVTAKLMKDLCAKLEVPVLAAALQFPLLNPDIDMTLIGIGRMDNLHSTLTSLATPIYAEQWAEILALQEKQPFMYIQDDLHG